MYMSFSVKLLHPSSLLYLKSIFLFICRMVAADIAFYTGNVQALKGLKDLDLNMGDIWEQKRWCLTKRKRLSPHGWKCSTQDLNVHFQSISWIQSACQESPFTTLVNNKLFTGQLTISNRLRFLWTKSKQAHGCNTASLMSTLLYL